jgi:hypothetical protein
VFFNVACKKAPFSSPPCGQQGLPTARRRKYRFLATSIKKLVFNKGLYLFSSAKIQGMAKTRSLFIQKRTRKKSSLTHTRAPCKIKVTGIKAKGLIPIKNNGC